MSETSESLSKLLLLDLAFSAQGYCCERSRDLRQRGIGEMTWNILIHVARSDK